MYLDNDSIATLNMIFKRCKIQNEMILNCTEAVSFSKITGFKSRPYIFGKEYNLCMSLLSSNKGKFVINVTCKNRNIDFIICFNYNKGKWSVTNVKNKGYYKPVDSVDIGENLLSSFIVYQYLVKNYWNCFSEERKFFSGLGVRESRIENLAKICKIENLNDTPPKKELSSYVLDKAKEFDSNYIINVNKYESCRTRQITASAGMGVKFVSFLNSDKYDNRKWLYNFYLSKEDIRKYERKEQNTTTWVMIERLENNIWLMECSNNDTSTVTKIKCTINVSKDNNIFLDDVEIEHITDNNEDSVISEDYIRRLHKEFMFWHCAFMYFLQKDDYLVDRSKRNKRGIFVECERSEMMWDASILHKVRKVKKELKLNQ